MRCDCDKSILRMSTSVDARQQLKNIGGLRLAGIVNSTGRYDYLFMRRPGTLLNVIECCYVNKIIVIGTLE